MLAEQCLITKNINEVRIHAKMFSGFPWSCELILKSRQNCEETYTYEGVYYFVKIETSYLLKINSF